MSCNCAPNSTRRQRAADRGSVAFATRTTRPISSTRSPMCLQLFAKSAAATIGNGETYGVRMASSGSPDNSTVKGGMFRAATKSSKDGICANGSMQIAARCFTRRSMPGSRLNSAKVAEFAGSAKSAARSRKASSPLAVRRQRFGRLLNASSARSITENANASRLALKCRRRRPGCWKFR